MVMTRPSRWLLVLTLAAGCGRVLGIHDSHLRDGGAATGGGSDAGPDRGGAGSGGLAGTGGPAGAGAAGTGGVAGAGGAGTGGGAGTNGSAGTSGGAGAGTPDAAADARDAASVDADAGVKSDASDGPPAPMCPAAPTQMVTAYIYAFGPHGAAGLGQCGFPSEILPPERYYGAVGPALYAGSAACGGCLVVEDVARTKSVEVQIIDSTGTDSAISIDAPSHAMLSVNGNNPTVRVHFAPCSYKNTTIKAAFKEAGFAAAILFDHRTRPTKVEIRGQNDTSWISLVRQNFNYWFPPAMYTSGGPAALRITDEAGSVVTTDALAITPAFRDTARQFPACAQ
jgi:hypothetical protein